MVALHLIAGFSIALAIFVYIERTLVLSTIHQELRNIEADIAADEKTFGDFYNRAGAKHVVERIKRLL